MPSTKDAHLSLIETALDEIEAGLRRPLNVDQVARTSGMSFWHFQRTFCALTGEPVGSYIRRRRLSAAARDLLRTRRRILDIALDYQFESHSSFTRAFRATFGISPAHFRRNPISFLPARPRLTGERLRRLQEVQVQPEIIELPALHLLGLSTRFIGTSSERSNNTIVLPRLWQAFLSRVHEIGPAPGAARYGACDCLPREQRVDHDELRYLAACAVLPPVRVPAGMVHWSAPPSLYARFIHRGPVRAISATLEYIYAVWLPRCGYERGPGFDLELYDARFSATAGDSEMEYVVPISR